MIVGPITIDQVSPSSVNGDSKVEITISGSGFEVFSGCLAAIDVNGDTSDCLACIFGDLEISSPVAANFIDSSHISCDLPPRNSLNDQSPELSVWVSKNNQIYFANTNTGISFNSTPSSSTSPLHSPPPSASVLRSIPPSPPATGRKSSATTDTSSDTTSSSSERSDSSKLTLGVAAVLIIVVVFEFIME